MSQQNYDPHELAKFASLAAHWWDPAGDLKTLHQVNPIRLRYILEKIKISNPHIIDIGCGGGILSESLAKAGAKVTGVDLNKPLIEVAQLHQLESGTEVEYLHTSAELIANERPAYYDVVICLEMLEHVPDPLSIIRAAAQLAKPNGHVFFSTLNRCLKSYLFAILGAEYVLNLLPKNTHDYAKFIRPSELSAWARECHIVPQETKGICYRPFSKQFELCDDVSVNYLFHGLKKA